MLKRLLFKEFLNELLLETELSEVMLIWWYVSIKLIRSFSKFSFLMSLFKRFLVIFTLLEEQSLFHLQISHSSSGFFTQNGIIFFFSFAHFNEIVKPKCTAPFSKLLKSYICHVIKSSSIVYTFKKTKKKDFRKWEGETLSKWWFIYKQLEKW